MYLNKLTLDFRNSAARRDLADPYEMHRTLVRAFVTDHTQVPPRFLWRLEPQLAPGKAVVLVQSAQSADWSGLRSNRDYLQNMPETKHVSLDQLLEANAAYRFRLLANPTVTRNGKRYGLVTEDAQLEWLNRQGKHHGFLTQAVMVTATDILKSRKHEGVISLRRVCYDGILQVVDVPKVKAALLSGIGPGKAFGCGLLSLARA